MEQFFEFVTNHPILWALLILISILLIKNLLADLSGGTSLVDPSAATLLMNRENAILLDIRKPEDFSKGHILSAINIPLSELENRISELEKYRERPIIICCNTGTTATLAMKQLKKMGFEKIYRLKGGIEGWKQASLPLAT